MLMSGGLATARSTEALVTDWMAACPPRRTIASNQPSSSVLVTVSTLHLSEARDLSTGESTSELLPGKWFNNFSSDDRHHLVQVVDSGNDHFTDVLAVITEATARELQLEASLPETVKFALLVINVDMAIGWLDRSAHLVKAVCFSHCLRHIQPAQPLRTA